MADYRSVMKILSSVPIKWEMMKGCGFTCGYWIGNRWINEKIAINPKKDVVPTAVHEAIHCIHPEWREVCVYAKEREIVRKMSKNQAVKMLGLVMRRTK